MMQVKHLLYLSTILISFFPITKVATASPTSTPSTVLQVPSYGFSADQQNREHLSLIQSNQPSTGDSPIVPRTDEYEVLPMSKLNPGWELDFYEFDWGYLPLSSASIILQGFYNRVIELATTHPGPMPEHSVIRWGQLDLEIVASHGTVAWASIATFAAHMLQTARRGYTNSYHCLMTNIAAGVCISFNLYVSATWALPPPVPKFSA